MKKFSRDALAAGMMMGLFCSTVLPVCAEDVSGARPVLPAQELLQYAVTDLQEIMQQAVAKNVQIEEKNQALRQRILLLEDKNREQEGQKKDLLAEQESLKAVLALKAGEVETLKGRLTDVEERKRGLGQKQVQLKEQISNYQAREEKVKAEVEVLKDEVRYFQQRLSLRGEKTKRPENSTRKTEINRQVEEKTREIGRLEKELPQIKRAAEVHRQNKEQLLARQKELNMELDSLRQQSRRVAAELNSLNAKDQEFASREKGLIEKTRQALKDLADYKTALRESLDVLGAAKKKAEDSWQMQRQPLLGWQRSLQKENEVLKKRLAVLKEYQKNFALVPSASTKEPAPTVAGKPVAQPDWKSDIRSAQLEIKDYRRQEKAFAAEIKGLRNDVARLERRDPQKIIASPERLRLEKMLAQFDNKNTAVPTAVTAVALEEPQSIQEDDITLAQQIEDLKSQESVLGSSLSIIESRYQQEKAVADAFLEEESQLNEYLAVLKKENKSLQEKILTLLMAVDKLKGPGKNVDGN